jgi:hypothetical protein
MARFVIFLLYLLVLGLFVNRGVEISTILTLVLTQVLF